jgi:hypothetical protein
MKAAISLFHLGAMAASVGVINSAAADTPPSPRMVLVDSQVCRISSAGLNVLNRLMFHRVEFEEVGGKISRVRLTGSFIEELAEPLPLSIIKLAIRALSESTHARGIIFLEMKSFNNPSLDLEENDAKLEQVVRVVQSVLIQSGHGNVREARLLTSEYSHRHFAECSTPLKK